MFVPWELFNEFITDKPQKLNDCKQFFAWLNLNINVIYYNTSLIPGTLTVGRLNATVGWDIDTGSVICVENGKIEIAINNKLLPLLFIAAHEVAHYILHLCLPKKTPILPRPIYHNEQGVNALARVLMFEYFEHKQLGDKL